MELAMTNMIPLDHKKPIAASLQPDSFNEVQTAIEVLSKGLPIMPSIQDPIVFKGIMAEFLAPYPTDVLMRAVNQAIRDFKYMPSINELVAICEQLVASRRAEIAEVRRRQQEREERQRRCRDFRARLAIATGDDAPSLNDVDLAEGLTPALLAENMPMSWLEFADEDPRACAELIKRLAEIARRDLPDWGEIRRLLSITAEEWNRRHMDL
jgi:hypothetical protein